MAIEIKSIPTLEGEKALAFIERISQEEQKKVSKEKVREMREAAKRILEATK